MNTEAMQHATANTASAELSQQLGMERMEEINAIKAESRRLDMGAKDKHSFLQMLVNKYGSLHRAWVKALDNDGNGRLSKMEFFDAARALGYKADLRELWKELDQDGSGMISLDELAHEENAILESFFNALKREYGTIFLGWRALDADRSGRATRPEFVEMCQKLEVDDSVFDLLDLEKTGFVHLEQLDPAAAAAVMRGEEDFLLSQSSAFAAGKSPAGGGKFGMTAASQRTMVLSQMQRRASEVARAEEDKKNVGAKTTAEFIRILVGRFGSVVRAWRQHLDKHEIGRLSFVQFCNAARAMGYCGNLKQLWKEMDSDGGGFVELQELDLASSDALKEFQQVLLGYPSLDDAWRDGLDPHRANRLDKTGFGQIVRAIGYTGSLGTLWAALDLDGGGFITKDEIKFLWKWAPTDHPDHWREVIRKEQAKVNRRRNRRAALRLPPLQPRAPPLSEDQLMLVEPLLRSTLSALPDLSESAMLRSGSMPSVLSGGQSTMASSWGLESVASFAATRRKTAMASPQFGAICGRSFRIQ